MIDLEPEELTHIRRIVRILEQVKYHDDDWNTQPEQEFLSDEDRLSVDWFIVLFGEVQEVEYDGS